MSGTEDGDDLDEDYGALKVVQAFPAALRAPDGGEEIFRRLAGATIVRMGAAASGELEGGGLVLDYTLPNAGRAHRLVFEFNELGMWLAYDSFQSVRNESVSGWAHVGFICKMVRRSAKGRSLKKKLKLWPFGS